MAKKLMHFRDIVRVMMGPLSTQEVRRLRAVLGNVKRHHGEPMFGEMAVADDGRSYAVCEIAETVSGKWMDPVRAMSDLRGLPANLRFIAWEDEGGTATHCAFEVLCPEGHILKTHRYSLEFV